ncbi:MAG: hypothetical protein GY847_06040 [Proteobacteria bacterium]|nr:hypothetical protein [Pseudomonadota bacterium]
MSNRFVSFLFKAVFAALTGCGASAQSSSSVVEPALDGPVASKPQSVLTRAELTTAVDKERMLASAPTATEFLPGTQQIFFVGTLTDLPDDAEIEVRWSKTSEGEPLYVSSAVASGTHSFLSKLLSRRRDLASGQYKAIVYVNKEEIGGVLFRIADRRSGGVVRVKELAVAAAVEVQTNRAIDAKLSFRKRIKKVFASFFVSGLEEGATIRVLWYHNEELKEEYDIESKGEKRYAVVFNNRKGLANGDWSVEVEVLGEVFAERTFFIGDDSSGPGIDRAALGTSLGRNRMPKRVKTIFKPNTNVIRCGIRFLDMPQDTKIEVQWVSLNNGSEKLLHTSDAEIQKSGSSAIGVEWNPDGNLQPGPYKAAILVNGRKMEELPFTIE